MSKEIGIDLDNHLSKCRVCLKDFEIDDTQIKITRIVEIRVSINYYSLLNFSIFISFYLFTFINSSLKSSQILW